MRWDWDTANTMSQKRLDISGRMFQDFLKIGRKLYQVGLGTLPSRMFQVLLDIAGRLSQENVKYSCAGEIHKRSLDLRKIGIALGAIVSTSGVLVYFFSNVVKKMHVSGTSEVPETAARREKIAYTINVSYWSFSFKNFSASLFESM